jgi:hypothetical protein
MIPLSACVIDDRIPISEIDSITGTEPLNASNLRQLVGDDSISWRGEDSLKDIITKFVEDTNSWEVSAFTHPDIYFGTSLYCPDIIILDWDLGLPEPTEDILEKILKKSFAIVAIFSGCDKIDEIKAIVNSSKFSQFANGRIKIYDKNEEDSHISLIETAKTLYKDNFSFKFGKKLRNSTSFALEHILVELGKMPIGDVLNLLHQDDENKPSEDELVTAIAERIKGSLIEDDDLRSLLDGERVTPETREKLFELIIGKLKDEISFDIPSGEEGGSGNDEETTNVAKKLWSYRLYHRPSDDLVRRGDIIKKTTSGTDKLFLVVSANCDLNKFWHKNFGHINLVPLYKISAGADFINTIKQTRTINSEFRKGINITSLANHIDGLPAKGSLILPFIKEGDNFSNYILFPKELFSQKVIIPKKLRPEIEKSKLKKEPLKYTHLKRSNKYDGCKRIAISEPFLTPLIEFIMSSITGFGTPDYPKNLRAAIKEDLKSVLS